MKARLVALVAPAAAVTLTAVAAAGPDAAKQRVRISMKNPDNGTFVLTPLQAGTLKRDSGTVSLVSNDPGHRDAPGAADLTSTATRTR